MKYKKYLKFKDSEIEWLGEVPEHWDIVRNKAVFQFIKSLVGEDSKKYKLLSLTLKGIILRDIESGKGKFPAEFNTYQKVKKNDLIFCLFDIDETPRTIGISKHDGMITGAYDVARCNDKVSDSKFMYYYYLSVDEYKGLKPFYTGLRKVVRAETFMNIQLALPPYKEQQQIAKFLDNATQKMDTLIQKQENLIKLLKEKRQAVISHAVTRGLNPDVKFKDSGVEWLGDVPEHWEIKQYRYATKIYRGKFTHRPRNDPKFYDGKYPFIQTGDIARANKYILNYSQTLNEKGILVSEKFPKGSLVMTIAANIGDVAILNFDAYAPDSIVSFAPTKLTNLLFLRYSFIGLINVLKSTAIQSTQANLNVDRIGSLIAIFPSLEEQQEIATYLDDKTQKIDKLIKKATKSIKLLKEKRTALISAAVTGKIDVREQV
jgi:type I restriction enzyme, S subunit